MHVHIALDLLQLRHHLLVDMKTSRRIQDHYIMAVLLGMFHSCLRDIHRLVVLSHGKNVHLLFLTVDLQLFDGRRSVDITGHQQRLLAL